MSLFVHHLRRMRSLGQISLNGFAIFATGVAAALILYELFHLVPYAAQWQRHAKANQLQYMPEERLLQVRDDFAVYAPPQQHHDLSQFRDLTLDEEAASTAAHEANIMEALGSLKLAEAMCNSGKEQKAQTIFKRALTLAPKHPDVLLRYGECLEHQSRDILQANHLYYKAFKISPGHSEALANLKRTASMVQTLDEERLRALDVKRDALSAIHESNASLRRAKKEAYFQHIYHSVGIEGNSMTLSQTRSILETRMAIDGKPISEHNEILGMDAAMKYINATLVNKMDDITLKDILEIHRRVLGHVDPIEGGEFRRTQVYVGGHVPPGPGDLAILMAHFERWLNSDEALEMHPIEHAALAHYKLVHIHPFVDGNGRTSRLLMNTLLMRAGYPPVIIPKQQRHKYYHFLQVANDGDVRPFVRFIAECTNLTLDLYLWATGDIPRQLPMLLATQNEKMLPAPSDSNGKYSKEAEEDFFDVSGSGAGSGFDSNLGGIL